MRRGAVGRVRTLFPGAIRSQRELSLALSVDLVIWRPPTYVGTRDHRPTAFAAPRFSYRIDFKNADRHRRPQGRPAPGGPAAARRCQSWRAGSILGAPRRTRSRDRAAPRRPRRLGLLADPRRTGH